MRVLRAHHITKLIEAVDTCFPREVADPRGGRPIILHENEVIALLVFSGLVAPQRTLKGILTWANAHYYRRFHLPSYKSWLRKCHAALPRMLALLDRTLVKDTRLRFMDSTMLVVCKTHSR